MCDQYPNNKCKHYSSNEKLCGDHGKVRISLFSAKVVDIRLREPLERNFFAKISKHRSESYIHPNKESFSGKETPSETEITVYTNAWCIDVNINCLRLFLNLGLKIIGRMETTGFFAVNGPPL